MKLAILVMLCLAACWSGNVPVQTIYKTKIVKVNVRKPCIDSWNHPPVMPDTSSMNADDTHEAMEEYAIDVNYWLHMYLPDCTTTDEDPESAEKTPPVYYRQRFPIGSPP